MSDWEDRLRTEVDASSCAAVGRKIGYSRAAVSHIYHGRYNAGTDKIRVAFEEAYDGGIECPYLNETIARTACAEHRGGPLPTSNPVRFRHWTACRACHLNPDNGAT